MFSDYNYVGQTWGQINTNVFKYKYIGKYFKYFFKYFSFSVCMTRYVKEKQIIY